MQNSKWKDFVSIPNLMGYFRILLIPVYLYFYAGQGNYLIGALIIAISGITDMLDGKIARRFDMVTDFGKILDPIADKLTQGAIAISLALRYPLMRAIVIVFLIKEGYMAVMGSILLKKGYRTNGAEWYGKVCTAVNYVVMCILILFFRIPIFAANVLMMIMLCVMIVTLIFYLCFYANVWKQLSKGENVLETTEETIKEKKKNKKKIIIPLVVGVLVYYLLGIILSSYKQPNISNEYVEGFDTNTFYSDDVSKERAAIIDDNGEALSERIRMIANAKEKVVLSTFDIKSDETGNAVIAALLDAADRGVKVQMIVDGLCAFMSMEWNSYFYALAAHENVEIRIYNEINLLKPWTSMGRLHDKYIWADETVYILGGRNTYNYFLGAQEGHKNHDRDVMVYCGDAEAAESSLRQAEDYFEEIWNQKETKSFHNSEKLQKRGYAKRAVNELQDIYETLQEEHPEWFEKIDYAEITYSLNKVTLLANPTKIYPKEPQIFYALGELMKSAEKEVVIHTPYIICNDMMYQVFSKICEGEADVSMMTNSAVNNGNPFGTADYLVNKEKIIETGLRIYEYEGGISYHAKSIVIDDDLSIVGSFNMDMRSVYLDTELMIVIHGEEVNEQLRNHMREYEEESLLVIDNDTYKIPEGMTQQEMKRSEKIISRLIYTVIGWARFLM